MVDNTMEILLSSKEEETTMETQDRISQLQESIGKLKQELKQELVTMFSNDEDTRLIIEALKEDPTLRYTHRGLIASVDMELQDFDEDTEVAFEEYAESLNLQVDFTHERLYFHVSEYLMYKTNTDSDSIVICLDGQEEIINAGLEPMDANEILDTLREIAKVRNYTGIAIEVDEYGNVDTIDLS